MSLHHEPMRVAGVDEAGRGPLAGPVVAAACILPPDFDLPGLTDSKRLSPEARERLFEAIRVQALDFALAVVPPRIIDALNIREASFHAMRVAVARLRVRPDLVIVDGEPVPDLGVPQIAKVRADLTEPVVSAASILAKVVRDRIMVGLDRRFPGYNFARHKGYPTRAHREALRRLGPSPIHRKSYRPVRELL